MRPPFLGGLGPIAIAASNVECLAYQTVKVQDAALDTDTFAGLFPKTASVHYLLLSAIGFEFECFCPDAGLCQHYPVADFEHILGFLPWLSAFPVEPELLILLATRVPVALRQDRLDCLE